MSRTTYTKPDPTGKIKRLYEIYTKVAAASGLISFTLKVPPGIQLLAFMQRSTRTPGWANVTTHDPVFSIGKCHIIMGTGWIENIAIPDGVSQIDIAVRVGGSETVDMVVLREIE